MTDKALAKIFKALGDETRLEIVRMLIGKERCVCAFLNTFSMTQPAISNHLRVLREARSGYRFPGRSLDFLSSQPGSFPAH